MSCLYPSLCDHQCTVFAIYVGHFVLTHSTAVIGSWNNNAHVVFLECTKRACFHVASTQFDIECFIWVVFVFQTERRPEDLGNNRLFNGRERIGQGKSIHQPSSVDWCILIINTNGVLNQKQKVHKCGCESLAIVSSHIKT